MTYEIFGVVACIIASGFFSGTETAITAISFHKLEKIREKHKFIAPLVIKWEKNPSRVLSTILIGNNLVNIFGSILAAKITYHYMSPVGGGVADLTAVASMTVFVLIFGEITPKTMAKVKSEQFALSTLGLLRIFDIIFYPFSYILSKFAKKLLKIMGVDAKEHKNLTQSDIEYLIRQGSSLGVFKETDHGELLSSALEFKNTLVKEVMVPRTDIHFFSIETNIQEAIKKLSEWGHSRIPVYNTNRDTITGLLYSKDLVHLLKRESVSLEDSIETIIRKPVIFVPENQKIKQTLKTMQAKRKHLAIVVDEFGGTAGLITIEDILEELVGDIKDEDDREENQIMKISSSIFSVDAHIPISELREETGIRLPESDEYNSVGGFILCQTENVPEKGHVEEFEDYHLKVTARDERHIKRVEIRILNK
ncbi:MAG: hemolysin family protein [bacterium]